MRNKILIILFFLLPFSGFPVHNYNDSVAKDTVVSYKGKGLLGVSAGFIIGAGFSAKYFFTDKLATQVSLFGPRYNLKYYGITETIKRKHDILVGFSLYYYILKSRSLFFYAGGNYREHKDYEYDRMGHYKEKINTRFNTGIGLGVSYDLFDFTSINLMAGYAFYYINSELTSIFFSADLSVLFYIK